MELWGLGKLLPQFLAAGGSNPEDRFKPGPSMCTAQPQPATSQKRLQQWEVRNPAHRPVCTECLTQQKDGLDEATSYRTTTFRQFRLVYFTTAERLIPAPAEELVLYPVLQT